MKLRKDGWLIKMCYFFKSESQIPKQSSVCKLFWRFIGMILLMAIAAPMLAVVYAIISIFALCFANRIGMNTDDSPFVPISWWPKIKGHRIWPATIFGIPIAAYFMITGTIAAIPCLVTEQRMNTLGPFQFLGFLFTLILGMIVLVSLIFPAGVIIVAFFQKRLAGETGQLIRAWLKAKVIDKACPLVEIE